MSLIAHFKQRPKTALILVLAVAAVAGAWQLKERRMDAEYGWGAGGDGYAYREESSKNTAGMPSSIAPMAPPMMDAVGRGSMPYPTPRPTAGETAAEVDQKIVKNGRLELVVDKVAEASEAIGRIATSREGFVQSTSVTERGDGSYAGDISIRVPVAKFEEAVTEIKKLANLVRNENATGQDVTEQYTDLQAQLRNAQAQEATYLEILKRAEDVEDVLAVQDRLGSIRAEIESLQGRMKYIENTTSYSTISVWLQEETVLRAPTKEFRFGAIVRDAVRTLVAALQDLAAGLVYAVIVWGGILLPIGLIAFVIWKIWKGRRGTPNVR